MFDAGTTSSHRSTPTTLADFEYPEEWTAEDDAIVAALTEAAWLDAGQGSSLDHPSPELPIEVLAAILGGPGISSGAGLVEGLRARARVVAYHQARLLESMMEIVDEYASVDDNDPALVIDGASAEISAALSLTRRAAESDLDLAWSLRERLPQVLEALLQGTIDIRRAWVLVQGVSHLDESEARSVATEALARAHGQTAGQLRALVRRLCLESVPDEAVCRYQAALSDRRVMAELSDDTTATIVASDLPPERVAAVMARIDRMARSLRHGTEERTIDQLRADVFLDLLEGGPSGATRASVDIRVDLTTLIGLNDAAVELGGYGPVVADIARQLAQAHGSSWRVTVTDGSGGIVHSGTTRRRPTAPLRRLVEVRDRTCIFPGCRMPARSCDLDHRIRVADGGVTHDCQLAALCRHHHGIRHRYGWTHRPNPGGGYTWTSPFGVRYVRPPPA